MHGKPITKEEVTKMVHLRKTGHSLPEIMAITKRGSSTVFGYVKDIEILSEHLSALKIKQGGSRKRSNLAWEQARIQANKMLGVFPSKEQRLYLLAALYWGEGNKKELNLINSDPGLVKSFISCLEDIGIKKDRIKIGIRIHRDIEKRKAIAFWSDLLSIKPQEIVNIEVIDGKKTGKLPYGMCRVRVAKSAPYFKLVMSLIETIKERFNAAVVQRIEQGTPKP